jgi:hypothetical protein
LRDLGLKKMTFRGVMILPTARSGNVGVVKCEGPGAWFITPLRFPDGAGFDVSGEGDDTSSGWKFRRGRQARLQLCGLKIKSAWNETGLVNQKVVLLMPKSYNDKIDE